MQYTLKNGIILYYDEPTHTYKVGGKNIPSVTGITSKGLIKDGLTNWKISFPLGQAKREINQMLKDEKPLDKFSLERFISISHHSPFSSTPHQPKGLSSSLI